MKTNLVNVETKENQLLFNEEARVLNLSAFVESGFQVNYLVRMNIEIANL